ncbi:MAG: cell division protein FtsA [Spirochaetales bacterium]|nr:cell division protein FtsA [Spirochaetales bacterium]MBR6199453.1 cell division protein FtsA [Spirochaetales bacterium]
MDDIRNNLIAAIDIGSSKIVTIIAEVSDSDDHISILGYGCAPTQNGIKDGTIQNIDAVVAALKKSTETAEIQATYELGSIPNIYVGISNTSIETINSTGQVAIPGDDKEVRIEDINRVIGNAQAVDLRDGREILHILPQCFSVNGGDWIKYPLGMVGARLECRVHIITGSTATSQTVLKSLERADIIAKQLVCQNLANAKAVLTDDEKELGVLLIDIGADTCKVSVYYEGTPYYNCVMKLGGKHITGDISQALKIMPNNAETIKVNYGVTDFNYVDESEYIQVPHVGGREPKKLRRSELVYVIKPRVEEIFGIIRKDLADHNMLDKMTSGVVLTGGSTMLPGIEEVCQEVFGVQSRVATLPKFDGLGEFVQDPSYSVALGLIMWGYDKMKEDGCFDDVSSEKPKSNIFQKIGEFWNKMF